MTMTQTSRATNIPLMLDLRDQYVLHTCLLRVHYATSMFMSPQLYINWAWLSCYKIMVSTYKWWVPIVMAT